MREKLKIGQVCLLEKAKVKSCLTLCNFMDCFIACQAPLSMVFSRQEYWSGLPFPSPGYLPNPGSEHGSPALLADSLPSEPPGKTPKRDIQVFNLLMFFLQSGF